jgi:methyl-accepting chemotaxis protein
MSRLAELGVAKRLSLIVLAGVVALIAVGVISMVGQRHLNDEAEHSRSLAAGLAALNHLDTRQSELKVDAYRAALGQDVSSDVADDVVSATGRPTRWFPPACRPNWLPRSM